MLVPSTNPPARLVGPSVPLCPTRTDRCRDACKSPRQIPVPTPATPPSPQAPSTLVVVSPPAMSRQGGGRAAGSADFLRNCGQECSCLVAFPFQYRTQNTCAKAPLPGGSLGRLTGIGRPGQNELMNPETLPNDLGVSSFSVAARRNSKSAEAAPPGCTWRGRRERPGLWSRQEHRGYPQNS